MEEKKTLKVIDIKKCVKEIWTEKRLFYKTLPIAFILSCVYIFSLPRYYTADTKLAPEMENSLGKGSLSSIASSLGFDIGEIQTTDAITPLLYPDLMEDNGFITSLFNVKVKSKDSNINTIYYNYLKYLQKKPWWLSIFSTEKKENDIKLIDAYNLSKKDDEIASTIRDKILLHVNSKSGVISIIVQDQDPLISKTMTDSVREKLQTYITNYRTNKARTDYEYYKKLTFNAKQEYEKVRRQYASMADASTNVSLRSVELRMEDLENDMQLKFNTYTNLNNQLQAAKAKVQERTPVFTILKGAAVPIKPSGPKRIIFVAVITLLTFIGTAIWIVRKDISDIFV
jgi:hypothetical protein